ncbi:MAG: S41 family peptidase [Candidatus Eisenbacteria bacterium]
MRNRCLNPSWSFSAYAARPLLLLAALTLASQGPCSAATAGYYRQPAIHGDTVVFVAEGDLWKVSSAGGVATRLTTHAGLEGRPVLSPDGSTLAFTAQCEGPAEVYSMPAGGGLPRRWTFDAARSAPAGFMPDGRLLYVTRRYSGLPGYQAVILDLQDGESERVPLAQAAEIACSDDGSTFFFVRFPFQGSHTKRYQGGTAQDIWRFDPAAGGEARSLTGDHPGTDRNPMFWQGRVYFVSDRGGALNIWSMAPDGTDQRQHTRHLEWDVRSAALSQGRIVYQLGADLHLLDLASGEDRLIPITLATDLDQMREKWIAKPWDWLTSAHLSPSGERVALTARGRVFVAPQGPGRLIDVTREAGVRYRDARFLPGGDALLALSDEGGEVEFWQLPADGIGDRTPVTRGAQILRWGGVPSPDGKHLAHHDKNHVLWMTTLKDGATIRVDESLVDDFADLAWSPDGRWLAYVAWAENLQRRIRIYEVEGRRILDATTDRYDSYSPAWSADGRRLYFLSDRHLSSLVRDPWGSRQPDPYFERTTMIYELALTPGLRSPFEPSNELAPAEDAPEESTDATPPPRVAIEAAGLAARLVEVPIEPGNYSNLFIAGTRLYWLALPDRHAAKRSLRSAPMQYRDLEVATLADSLEGAELSADAKKILLRTGDALHVIDAGAGEKPELNEKTMVGLSQWAFSLDPREEWRQMFIEAWRLERDYFYDPQMHGVDWPAMRDRYLPLVERVSDRAELSDLLAQMVSELSALHIFVYGGDFRSGKDDIQPAELGALLERDAAAGGYRVERVFLSDPDRPALASPLARPGVAVEAGDVILSVDGVPALAASDAGALLRHKAGRQVLLEVRPQGTKETRRVIVNPLASAEAADLRYHEWEYTRRLEVERRGDGRIGYVHLRAMGGEDIDQWMREFYPVFDREGLIIDVRHNGGGNIDSWILGKLLRKAWFWWQPRIGLPSSNMQFAFNGHMTVLCDENTASDGEAFAEGFRRLGLGKVIGTRTWGGEIWLSSSNVLVDQGIATAAEFGVYGPEGQWLIEGHGVDPDIVVDNLPHETFQGRDAQLEAAVGHLLERMAAEPVRTPPAPPYPDKSR